MDANIPLTRRLSLGRLDYCIGAGLLLLTLITYWNVINNSFVPWDDDIAITGNPYFRGLSSDHFYWMFTNTSVTLRYEPLTWLLWAILYEFVGLSPAAFHTFNLFFHIVNTLLFFLLLRALLVHLAGKTAEMTRIAWCAGIGAAFWGLHPLRVEVVSWATQVCFGGATCFSLLTLLLYLRAIEKDPVSPSRTGWFYAATASFALAALFFPSGIGVAALLPFLDVLLLKRLPARAPRGPAILKLVAEKWPFLVIALAIGVVTIYGRVNAGGIWSGTAKTVITPLECLMQASYIFAYYLWKPFFFLNHSPVYTTLVAFEPLSLPFITCLLFVLLMTVVSIALWRRYPLLALFWAAHLCFTFPFGGYFDRPHYASDRYAYLQSILLPTALAALLVWAWPRVRTWSRAAVAVLMAASILIFMTLSNRSVGYWRDGETLYKHVLAELGNDPYRADIQQRLALLYLQQGRYSEALTQADSALAIVPVLKLAQVVKGETLLRLGDQVAGNTTNNAAAMAMYVQAAETLAPLMPITPDPHVTEMVGVAYAKAQRFADAEETLRAGLRRFPRAGTLEIRLRQVLYVRGRDQEAIEMLSEAVRHNPDLMAVAMQMRAGWEKSSPTSASRPE